MPLRKVCLVATLLVAFGCQGRVDAGSTAPCGAAASDATASDSAEPDVADAEAEANLADADASAPDASEPDAAEAEVEAQADTAAPEADVAEAEAGPVEDAASDASTPARDAGNHCTNGKQDFDESDVDCGGSCAPCGLTEVCFADTDCSATAAGCNVDAGGCYCLARALVCVASHCLDHKIDVDETALDCGGRSCAGCVPGLPCRVDTDCRSMACDSLSLTCAYSQCADHHQDGSETDVDCGGGACNPCYVGQKCGSNFDCIGGHFCARPDAGTGVCQ